MQEDKTPRNKIFFRSSDDSLIDLNVFFLHKIKRGSIITEFSETYTIEITDKFGQMEIAKFEEEKERDECWVMINNCLESQGNVEILER